MFQTLFPKLKAHSAGKLALHMRAEHRSMTYMIGFDSIAFGDTNCWQKSVLVVATLAEVVAAFGNSEDDPGGHVSLPCPLPCPKRKEEAFPAFI